MSGNVPGVPAITQEAGEQHRRSAGLLVHRLTHRKRALLEQALDKIMEGAGKGGDRDPVARLAAEYFNDPKAWLSWLNGLLPHEQPQAAGPSNIGAMFLQAVQSVSKEGKATRTINAVVLEPGTTGVQDSASDW